MLNLDDIMKLQQLIEAEGNNCQTILGARIGDIVKINFPDIKVKTEFGSINKLIERHLSHLLTFSAKHGKDNEYAFRKTTQAVIDERDVLGVISEEPLSKNNDNNTLAYKALVVSRALLHEKSQHQPNPNPDEILRSSIKISVDAMSSEQLRQLVIPAGILFDAICKNSRV